MIATLYFLCCAGTGQATDERDISISRLEQSLDVAAEAQASDAVSLQRANETIARLEARLAAADDRHALESAALRDSLDAERARAAAAVKVGRYFALSRVDLFSVYFPATNHPPLSHIHTNTHTHTHTHSQAAAEADGLRRQFESTAASVAASSAERETVIATYETKALEWENKAMLLEAQNEVMATKLKEYEDALADEATQHAAARERLLDLASEVEQKASLIDVLMNTPTGGAVTADRSTSDATGGNAAASGNAMRADMAVSSSRSSLDGSRSYGDVVVMPVLGG